MNRLVPLRVFPLFILAQVGFGCSIAEAAYEWRGYWGAPSTLEVLADQMCVAGKRCEQFRRVPRLEVAHRQPFGLPGVSFEKLRWHESHTGLSLHLGWLRGPAYQEWHVGVGRTIHRGPLRLFAGGRCFGLSAGESHHPVVPAGTFICSVSPPGFGGGRLSAGVVDLSLHPSGDVLPVFLLRVRVAIAGVGLLAERTATYPARSETTLLVSVQLPSLELCHGFRWATGETLLDARFVLPRGTIHVGGCWHPDLGWTPRIGAQLLLEHVDSGVGP